MLWMKEVHLARPKVLDLNEAHLAVAITFFAVIAAPVGKALRALHHLPLTSPAHEL
jgi:hypothetical protein